MVATVEVRSHECFVATREPRRSVCLSRGFDLGAAAVEERACDLARSEAVSASTAQAV